MKSPVSNQVRCQGCGYIVVQGTTCTRCATPCGHKSCDHEWRREITFVMRPRKAFWETTPKWPHSDPSPFKRRWSVNLVCGHGCMQYYKDPTHMDLIPCEQCGEPFDHQCKVCEKQAVDKCHEPSTMGGNYSDFYCGYYVCEEHRTHPHFSRF